MKRQVPVIKCKKCNEVVRASRHTPEECEEYQSIKLRRLAKKIRRVPKTIRIPLDIRYEHQKPFWNSYD